MLNNRRSEIEIIRDILVLSQSGAKKTEIMYQVNLSYFQLNNYLESLLNIDLLTERAIQINGNGLGKEYVTTEKGVECLSSIHSTIMFFTPQKESF